MKLLPRGPLFWTLAVCWRTYPFRIVWIGPLSIAYDRSARWYARWPHLRISWNED
jgi:hypothetical protein